ncbi:hypothetical protein [Branchiibius cervicis]|uniref:Cold-shock protein n=1 Tax=Branchiibius cervicis TaxID=908252 RepID=A0ABW2AUE0_9MICO
MQATVHEYDALDGRGSVLTDNGRILPFSAEVFQASSLRLLRVGQRLNIEVGPDGVNRLWLSGIGPGQTIR